MVGSMYNGSSSSTISDRTYPDPGGAYMYSVVLDDSLLLIIVLQLVLSLVLQ